MRTLWVGFLGLGLLLAGCGDGPSAGTRAADAGDDGQVAADAQPAGSGGATGDTGATGGAGGQALADAGGSGGGAGTGGTVAGTGGAGSGGAMGSGGMAGSGGAMGSGGAPVTPECVDPMGWKIQSPGACLGPTTNLKKGGRVCRINCRSVQPNGLSGNSIGPPLHPECITPLNSDDPGYLCVRSCGECS